MSEHVTPPSGFTPESDGIHYIYRPWRRLPDGTVLWAKNFGKKAWRIPISDAAEAPLNSSTALPPST